MILILKKEKQEKRAEGNNLSQAQKRFPTGFKK